MGVNMRASWYAAALAAVAFAPTWAMADTVGVFGNTTGTGPWELTSTCDPSCPPYTEPPITYSGVYVTLDTPIAFSALATLSATFVDHTGGAALGGPRIYIFTTGPDFFQTYLGTPPNFNDSDPSDFTTNYSGLNLNNASANTQIGYGNPYYTLASLEGTYGSDLVGEIDFVLDGGYGANGPQDLTLTALTINGTDYTSSALPTPLPGALSLLASGLGVLGALGWRKRRKTVAKS